MARRRTRKKKTSADSHSDPEHPSRSRRTKTAGRMGRKILIGLILAGILLFFLPSIVAVTPLGQMAINMATSGLKGRATVESMSVGWFSPVQLNGLKVVDEIGETILAVDQIRTSRTLLGLVNTANFGQITIQKPLLSMQAREDGSNLEDALIDLINQPPDPNARPIEVQIQIEDGRAQITDTASGAVHKLEQVAGTIQIPAESAPLNARMSGQVSQDGARGSFELNVGAGDGNGALGFSDGTVVLDGQSLPIDLASPFLSRFVEPMQIGGRLDGQVHVIWARDGEELSTRLQPATLTDLRIRAPGRIGDDQIRIQNAWLQGELGINPESIQASRFICRSELGTLGADGTVGWSQLTALAKAQIPGGDFRADGTLNLAPLVVMLPDTLPLQQGVAIESGTVQFNVNSQIDESDRRLVVNVESAGLTAVRQGQRINWHKPARLVTVLRQTPTAMMVESLEFTTNSLSLSGSATADQGEFQASGDLQAALAEVNQFFDLGGFQVGGQVNGQIAWQFDGPPTDQTTRPLRVGGNFRIRQPMLDWPGKTRWSEDELNIVVQAAGQMLPTGTGPSSVRFDSGNLELLNARQKLTVALAEPVTNPSWNTPISVDCSVGGELSTWLAQLRTWLTLDAEAGGNIDANARVSMADGRLVIQQSQFQIHDLQFRGYGLEINESQVSGDATMAIDLSGGSIDISDVSVTSSAVAARGQQLRFDPAGGTLAGQIAFRADVNRALALLGPPAPGAIQYFGSAQGMVELQTSADIIDGLVDVRVDDLIAARPVLPVTGPRNASSGQVDWDRLLEEKQMTLQSRLRMDRSFQEIRFENFDLASSAVNLQASGSVRDPAGALITDISGTWSPDWKKFRPLLRAWTNSLVKLNRVRGGPFQIRGPVFNLTAGQPGQPWLHPDLQVATSAEFQSGSLLGLPISGSPVNVNLAGGVAQIQTQPIGFSGGTINASPLVDLRGTAPLLVVPAGPVVDNVELTPEICRGWLKFVAPVIADATAATGRFSIATQEMQIPLENIYASNVEGTIHLHGGSIGPGPLSQQLIAVLTQVQNLAKGSPLDALPVGNSGTSATWMVLPNQQVPFALRQGRVMHQGMRFQVDDAVIRTTGSVGLDHSLQMVIEIPVLDKWIGNNRWAAGLRGQTLQVPISGTVSNPRIDNSALAQLSRQMLQGAAGNVINQEVEGLIQQGNQRLEDELFKGLGRFFEGGN